MKPRLSSPSVVTSGQFAYFPIFPIVLFSFACLLSLKCSHYSVFSFLLSMFFFTTANGLVSRELRTLKTLNRNVVLSLPHYITSAEACPTYE